MCKYSISIFVLAHSIYVHKIFVYKNKLHTENDIVCKIYFALNIYLNKIFFRAQKNSAKGHWLRTTYQMNIRG